MELYQLQTFVTVAEEGHLTRASERLHASQPAVSAHIKALEEGLETRLFIRTPKGMSLTEAGERLLDKAAAVLQAARELKLEARNMGDELVGELSLGLNTDARIPAHRAAAQFAGRRASPHHTADSAEERAPRYREPSATVRWTAASSYGPPRYPEIHAVRMDTTQFYVAVPEIWKDKISEGPEALSDLPWILDLSDNPLQMLIQPFLKANNIRPSARLEVDGDEVIRVLVAAGKGISFLRDNELKAANRIGKVHAVPFEELSIDLHFVCLKRRDQDPVMQAVIDLCPPDMGAGMIPVERPARLH